MSVKPEFKVTKEQVAAWMGSDNLSQDKLLTLLTELANGEYDQAVFLRDVYYYD